MGSAGAVSSSACRRWATASVPADRRADCSTSSLPQPSSPARAVSAGGWPSSPAIRATTAWESEAHLWRADQAPDRSAVRLTPHAAARASPSPTPLRSGRSGSLLRRLSPMPSPPYPV